MKKLSSLLFAIALAVGAPVFAAAPPDGGTISIQPKTADGEYTVALQSFVNATSEVLASKGFTILEGEGHAAYVAELTLSREDVGTGAAKVSGGRSSVMPGGAAGVGAGVTIPLPTGNSKLVALQRTQIEIRIRKRGEDAIVWKAAAMTVREAGTRKGANETVAADLSEAAFRSYPAEPTEIVGVP